MVHTHRVLERAVKEAHLGQRKRFHPPSNMLAGLRLALGSERIDDRVLRQTN